MNVVALLSRDSNKWPSSRSPCSRGSIPRDLLLLRITLLVLYALLLIRTSWLSDDCFITFRTIDNFLHGYGLRWNVSERVQAYTHPLWMLLLIAPQALTGEAFWSSHVFSMGMSLVVAALLLWKLASTPGQVLVVGAGVLLCNSYIDYSTSGLENPLSHLLVVCLLLYMRREDGKKVRTAALLLSLFILTRHDLVLLAFPALLWCIDWRNFNKKTALDIVVGLVPVFLWEAFSMIYYGFPFPNTAYAKLGAGLPPSELMARGVDYLVATSIYDPVCGATIAVGVLLALASGSWRQRALAAGVLLYTVYTVRAGGDFMAGRFLTAPFLVSLGIIVETSGSVKASHGALPWAAACAALALYATPTPAFSTGLDYSRKIERFPRTNGVGSERAFYYENTSFLRNVLDGHFERFAWVVYGKQVGALNEWTVRSRGAVGMVGYFGGPKVHLVDYLALGDAFLARLPCQYPYARVGHLRRSIPEGYMESCRENRNLIKDQALVPFYDAVSEVISGPLFSRTRWNAIVGLNTGRYDSCIDTEHYTYPSAVHVSLGQLAAHTDPGENWKKRGNIVMPPGGVVVALGKARHAGGLDIGLDHNNGYDLRLFMGDAFVGVVQVGPSYTVQNGMDLFRVEVPAEATRTGYDRIHIVPLPGDARCSLGQLKFTVIP